MKIMTSIFLGLVQGITEFLPISSSGHLAIFQNFFNMENIEESHLFFDVLLHLGTLISVCIVYRKDLMEMIRAVIGFFRPKESQTRAEAGMQNPMFRLVIFIIVATLPLVIVLPFKSKIEMLSGSNLFIGLMLLLTGCILYVSDKLVIGKKTERKMTVRDALLVGCSQAVATLPGLSRSGVTITAGLCLGFTREFAVKFSFLISILSILGANIVSLISAIGGGVEWSYMPIYLIGLVVAAVVGYFAIRLVKYMVDSDRFGKFAYYCWIVGVLVIILSFIC